VLALDDRPPVAAPPRRHRAARRVAVVLVAFVAACCVMLVPSTQDAAQALSIPPVVAAIGEEGALPATILEFNPAGFAFTAAAILGYLAWDNRTTLAAWAHNAWCFLGGCDGKPVQDPPGTLAPELHPTNPQTTQTYSMTHGSAPGTIAWSDSCVQNSNLTIDECTPSGGHWSAPNGALLVVCRGGPSATNGAVLVGRGSILGPVTVKTSAGSSVSLPSPATISGSGASSGVITHADMYVCPTGYEPARAEWWNTAGGSGTGADVPHGFWSDGNAVPTDTRIDVNCKRSDGSTYTVQGPVTSDPGDGSAGLTEPSCVPGDTVLGTVVNNRVTGDYSGTWASQTIPAVAPADQLGKVPDCLKGDGTSNGTCQVNVMVNGTICTVGDVGNCWDWQSEETT
jgi:hypothetical protein